MLLSKGLRVPVKYTSDIKEFLKEYEQYKERILNPTENELRILFKQWQNPENWSKYVLRKGAATPSPIRMAMVRIKNPEKVVDKIYRKPELFVDGLSSKSLYKMHDVIGARVIVYFSSQLPLIDKEIRSSNMLEISDKCAPEAYYDPDILSRLGLSHIERKQKESGYTSIHYILRLKTSSVKSHERPDFELQVRTLAQELWCELEHVLSYKPEYRTHFSAKRRFQILSKEVGAIDEHFNLLYEDLIHNQEIASYKDSDVLTFENLPKVSMEIGLKCSLTDLNPILKILFSRDIKTIGALLKMAIPRRLDTIRNMYVSAIGDSPDNIELISALVALKGAESSETEIERIKAHIEYHKLNL